MTELSTQEGQLDKQESTIVKNLLLLRETNVKAAMTPSSVVFSLAENMRVGEFFQKHENVRFSRIPIFSESREAVSGFVLRNDLLFAKAQGHTKNKIKEYKRDMYTAPASMKLIQAFEVFLRRRSHIMLIVDEYGGMKGIITL